MFTSEAIDMFVCIAAITFGTEFPSLNVTFVGQFKSLSESMLLHLWQKVALSGNMATKNDNVQPILEKNSLSEIRWLST